MKIFNRVGRILSSPQLTCGLLAYSVFFVFFASLEILELGIARVQAEFFEAWFCKFWAFPIYIFGGMSIGLLAFTNLIFSLVRFFRFNLKGISFVIIHISLVALILSGFLQSKLRLEAMLALEKGVPTSKLVEKTIDEKADKIIPLNFAIELVEFEQKNWENTDLPSSFSSRVKFIKGEDVSEKIITMNEPASFEGWTFFQMSYKENGLISILQAVKNPYGFLPAWSVCGVFVGIILMYLNRVLKRRNM